MRKFKHIRTIWLQIKKLNKDHPYVLEPYYYEIHPMDMDKGHDSFHIRK